MKASLFCFSYFYALGAVCKSIALVPLYTKRRLLLLRKICLWYLVYKNPNKRAM